MANRKARARNTRSPLRMLASLASVSLLGGCAVLTPLPPESGLAERLSAIPRENLPLDRPVSIYWNGHMVPFIDAETDGDAAFALGLAHAHLRLGQMEMSRRISQGRISEMAGPSFVDIDRSLRILGLGRASRDIVAALPGETRAWLDHFVAGVNFYQREVRILPQEFAVLGLEKEPWTTEDIVTLGRLAGVDVNWLAWLNLLPLHDRADWPRIWQTALRYGALSPTGYPEPDAKPLVASPATETLARLIGEKSRNGSNSIVIGGQRTESGAALIASDPHLGTSLPNFWLIAGLKSPSYHVVGLMPPGLPIFGLGRNPDIAWGGTNMRAASSDLVDISDVDPSLLSTTTGTIRTRFWFDDAVDIRNSPWGPAISDAPAFPAVGDRTLALRWMGHRASDEISAFLRASRAKTWTEFKNAFKTYAVSGQNMLYADRFGNIGQVSAARIPQRKIHDINDLIVDIRTSDENWNRIADSSALPSVFNPEDGAIASANNRPGSSAIPISYFFSPTDRIERLRSLIDSHPTVTPADLALWQRDVVAPSSLRLRDRLLAILRTAGWQPGPEAARVLALIGAWDGAYAADSPAALAFESFFADLAPRVYSHLGRQEEFDSFSRSSAAKDRLAEDIAALAPGQLRTMAGEALRHAAETLAKQGNWGAVHRLRLAHAFGGIPLLGSRYRFSDYPVGGSQETLMKTAHQPDVDEKHGVRYGSQARHISDLSDPDANDFVLLGGQDGWFGSSAFADQVDLWREGRFIRVPLSIERVRETFPTETRLEPGKPRKKP